MDIQKQIGLRIKGLRMKKGLSQERLALIAGLDRTYITTVENGKRNISIVNIEKISNALNLSLKEFFNNDWKK
ncbi:MAG TPA: helix-turn-helix transcriptional regulator [Candidatus Sumerlaeota bacterium]|jgi:transcriptional regulator with XRE-family HTH domain|nr:MAG: HTH-type transcriptional regulator PuuR [candidate division BRC1 bacterium ADurb.Bin183]HOE63398.1 helix-turn-helix transcriptional regulator [Candidatus Sumerlaeota bacterium]HRR30264.1 helix-turn-helix transcriptional regulator [Candidatus Sumerlaeia bacterium]HON50877.1 helix-turn-helix transcriptional regulator [Candidatus Sumerlaeota bacterium]HOR65570.1 helix-turn-helix transcriptional regulator [Candidatus Sumerlaeota bacterium]